MKGKISIDGYHFNNEHEYKRYLGILELVKSGRLKDFDVKPACMLSVNDIVVDVYSPTFRFYDNEKKELRHVQVQSGAANSFLELKIRLFEALYEVHVERWG